MRFFFFQAEDGIRDLVRSRGLGDVYKRQDRNGALVLQRDVRRVMDGSFRGIEVDGVFDIREVCLLYTSDAADERSSVDLGGRRIIKKKKNTRQRSVQSNNISNKEKTIIRSCE